MKTKEELNQLKQEFEALSNKLKELSEDELQLVTGGMPEYPEYDELLVNSIGHGKNGKPTLVISDEA